MGVHSATFYNPAAKDNSSTVNTKGHDIHELENKIYGDKLRNEKSHLETKGGVLPSSCLSSLMTDLEEKDLLLDVLGTHLTRIGHHFYVHS